MFAEDKVLRFLQDNLENQLQVNHHEMEKIPYQLQYPHVHEATA